MESLSFKYSDFLLFLSAIEAIKNAHRLELQREVQRRCEFENSNGLSNLEEVHRQHRYVSIPAGPETLELNQNVILEKSSPQVGIRTKSNC